LLGQIVCSQCMSRTDSMEFKSYMMLTGIRNVLYRRDDARLSPLTVPNKIESMTLRDHPSFVRPFLSCSSYLRHLLAHSILYILYRLYASRGKTTCRQIVRSSPQIRALARLLMARGTLSERLFVANRLFLTWCLFNPCSDTK